MKIVKSVREMQNLSSQIRLERKSIGFVPTMGFLHDGHISLVKESKLKSDFTVVSIFVNPAQFAPTEDLEKYPRDFDRDENLLITENVDVLFYPDIEEIYPINYNTFVEVENITSILEGESRPTHFRGVTTIVAMLFNIVKPDIAVFGQKDAQQATVIKKMVYDLKYDLEIVISPIVREKNGLAMSSRNVFLSNQERKDALVLSQSLKLAEKLIHNGERDFSKIEKEMNNIINSAVTSTLDYIKAVNLENFIPVEIFETGKSYFILIACKIGTTRLIDNLLIKIT